LITEAARAEGGWLLNKDGYRYLQDYDLGKPELKPVLRSMELGPRDRLSQAFVKEQEKGRTIEGPYGHYVHLDLRHLGEKLIDRKLPFVRELCLKYAHLDPVKEMIPVRPVVHYMMGGIHTDIQGATPIPGLYAAGEAACVSINGANRLGSNSLTEILVFGARAGQAAAAFAAEQREPDSPVLSQATDEQHRLEQQFLRKTGGNERIATLRTDMQEIMEQSAGIYREGETLQQAVMKLQQLQERFRNVSLDDHSATFNTELTSALELSYMLDLAQVIIASALWRLESRGSHQRTDHPTRDDRHYLAHSLARRDEGGLPRIELLPVKITRWPPGERVYGR
jgi:fumarate reductase flavoprotein subunit